MRRRDLNTRIRKRARAVGKEWVHERTGKHEVWRCGAVVVAVPRHRDICERTAEGIMKQLESELGEGWWR